jgi:hypothetical protein
MAIHDLRGKLQSVAAHGVTDFHGIIRAFHFARMPRVLEVLQYCIGVHAMSIAVRAHLRKRVLHLPVQMEREVSGLRQNKWVRIMTVCNTLRIKKILAFTLASVGFVLIPFAGFSKIQSNQDRSPATPRPQSDGFYAEPNPPFSATQITERTQILPDGTHVTTRTEVRVFRDSHGRLRTERFQMRPGSEEIDDSPNAINIVDPVAGFQYFLSVRGHSALRTSTSAVDLTVIQTGVRPSNGAKASGAAIPKQFGSNMGPQPQEAVEPLGTRVIEGLESQGTKRTTTFPPHSFGNDRPVIRSTEEWVSHELRLTVLSIVSDPRTGETKVQLTGISRIEPDASLFQVPDEYTIRAR